MYWGRGIRVFVCLMCEVKAGVYVFMSMSDVWSKGVEYICVCLMCEWRLGICLSMSDVWSECGGYIYVCKSDVWSEGMGYVCVYVSCIKSKLGIFVCSCMMSEVKAWDLCVYVCCVEVQAWFMCVYISYIWSDVWGYMVVYVWCVNWRFWIYVCVCLMCEVKA